MDRNGWVTIVALSFVLVVTMYSDSLTIRNRDKRIDELCDLCNQLTLENVDLKIRLRVEK